MYYAVYVVVMLAIPAMAIVSEEDETVRVCAELMTFQNTERVVDATIATVDETSKNKMLQ